MKELKLKVNGMMCEGCENRIKNVLLNIEGVEEVSANHIECEVKVTLNENVSQEKIIETITELGYEVEREN